MFADDCEELRLWDSKLVQQVEDDHRGGRLNDGVQPVEVPSSCTGIWLALPPLVVWTGSRSVRKVPSNSCPAEDRRNSIPTTRKNTYPLFHLISWPTRVKRNLSSCLHDRAPELTNLHLGRFGCDQLIADCTGRWSE